ncbi:MAG: metallophosphatase family protein [Thermoanaerobaculia bacterium]|nr:metallophosphatase family protein [Thermoanaerobaculia bacterium]
MHRWWFVDTHVARQVRQPDGTLVVNPGSVGLPAYTDDEPFPHAMEAGSPHARYAVLEQQPAGWTVEQYSVAYDWEAAALQAERTGRHDWAGWIRTGRG